MSAEAFVTLATTDGYALGALVLAQSIRQVGTTRNLVVLISNRLSDLIRKSLERSFDEVVVVDELDSNDTEHLTLLARPELGMTFTKINCWLLEQYSKCVFLDSDCLVLKPIDQLFQREELSAAPDAGWPDCFNSGVFVFRPSKDTFRQLVQSASQQSSSFDGGDQGLLNSFFSNWRTGDISRHLPFTYNVTANAFYSYLPAVTRFRDDIHIVHFAGALKPWQLTYNPQNQQLSGNLGGQNDIQREFLVSWWNVMHQRVWPKMQLINQQNSTDQSLPQNQSSTAFASSLNYGSLTEQQGIPLGSAAHRRAWESGHIDYVGRDSFSNIQQQLERNIQQSSYPYHPAYSAQTTTATPLPSSLKQTLPNNPTAQRQQPTNPRLQAAEEQPKTFQQTSVFQQRSEEQPKTFQQASAFHPASLQKKEPSALPSEAKSSVQSSSSRLTANLRNEEVLTQTSRETFVIETTASSQLPTVNQTTYTSSSSHSVNPPTSATFVQQPPALLKESLLTGQLRNQSNVPNEQQRGVHVTQTTRSEPPVTTVKQTVSQLPPSHASLKTSSGSDENHTPTSSDHQSTWTVKSSITTVYTQGSGELAGPTVVSKSVSESNAASSTDLPVKSAAKQISDSTNSSVLTKPQAKETGENAHWLFDKVFIAITYTISLCYLLFLVAMGRHRKTNIIPGSDSTIRGVTSGATTAKNATR